LNKEIANAKYKKSGEKSAKKNNQPKTKIVDFLSQKSDTELITPKS
jgi:hypothetical protein